MCTIIALLAFFNSNAQTKVQRLINSYSAISAESGIQVEITQGNEEAVFVSASDDSYTDNLKTVVENGILKIYYQDKDPKKRSVKNLRLHAFVSYKNINKLIISSGAAFKTINSIVVDALVVNLSSGAQFNGELKVTDFSLAQSSGAVSKITGTATNAKLNMSSGSVSISTDFITENCRVKASSGAVLKIGVTGKLNAKISSGAMLGYKGDAVVESKRVNSGGSLKKI